MGKLGSRRSQAPRRAFPATPPSKKRKSKKAGSGFKSAKSGTVVLSESGSRTKTEDTAFIPYPKSDASQTSSTTTLDRPYPKSETSHTPSATTLDRPYPKSETSHTPTATTPNRPYPKTTEQTPTSSYTSIHLEPDQPKRSNTPIFIFRLPGKRKEKEEEVAEDYGKKGEILRIIIIFLISIVFIMVLVEVATWFKLAHIGWPGWFRHPLSRVAKKLNQWESQGRKGEVMDQLERTLIRWGKGEVTKTQKKHQGPWVDGLDWWLAMGVGFTDLCLVITSWTAARGHFGFEGMHRRFGFLMSALVGALMSGGVGLLMGVWLVMAARDSFGVFVMFGPAIYCIIFTAIAIAFTFDLIVTEFD